MSHQGRHVGARALFLQALQDHYKVLFKEKDAAKFLRGMNEIVATSFKGADIKKGRKVVPLDSMATLEEAWRDWAARRHAERHRLRVVNMEAEVDRILDKVLKEGAQSLTRWEQEIMQRYSKSKR